MLVVGTGGVVVRITEKSKKGNQKMKNPRFNHAFTLAFAVPDSEHEDWLECLKNEKEKVINGLMERINVLLADQSEYLEALEGFDSHEE